MLESPAFLKPNGCAKFIKSDKPMQQAWPKMEGDLRKKKKIFENKNNSSEIFLWDLTSKAKWRNLTQHPISSIPGYQFPDA